MRLRSLLVLGMLILATPAAAAPVSVTVDISDQKMYVKVGYFTKYTWDVSTARPNYRTPTRLVPANPHALRGISRKNTTTRPCPFRSSFTAAMPSMARTDLARLGTPASHGCVRLDPSNAEKLFGLVKKNGAENTTIQIKS